MPAAAISSDSFSADTRKCCSSSGSAWAAISRSLGITRGLRLVRHSASLLAPEGKMEHCHVLLAGEVCSAARRPCALKRLPPKAGATARLSVLRHPRCCYRLAPARDRHDGDTGSVSRWLVLQPRIAQNALLHDWPALDHAEP